MTKLRLALTALALTGLCFAPVASAGNGNAAKGDKVDVIIGYTSKLDRGQADDVRNNGGKVKREFGELKMRSATLPAHVVDKLRKKKHVAFVVEDRPIEGFSASARATAFAPDAAATELQMSASSVGVAVIDSGIGHHPDLNVVNRINCHASGTTNILSLSGTQTCARASDTSLNGDYRDNFDVTSYTNSDGSMKWSYPWVEANDNGSPSGGNITVEQHSACPNGYGRCVEFDTRETQGVLQRQVNLSGAVAASLSFDYHTRYFDDEPVFVVEASADGGQTWSAPLLSVTTEQIKIGETIDLTPYMSASTVVRFRVATDDEYGTMMIDNVVVNVDSDDGFDPFGHGTHVAGVIGGNGASSNGAYVGIAPGVKIHSLRVFDEEGKGMASDAIAALDFILAYGHKYGIDVVNMSLGKAVEESNTTDPLVAAVEAVWDAGFVVVASAGNFGRDGHMTITSPGNSRKIITVGSITDAGTFDLSDDYVSTYSSKGPTLIDHVMKPDLVAPGNRYVAATPGLAKMKRDLPDRKPNCGSVCQDSYLELSGTSMAAGAVSGAVALMLDQDPTLTPSTVKARLMRSARKISEDPVTAGAGVLDVTAALAETGTVTGQALSPLMVRNANDEAIMVEDTADLWGDSTWSASFLWTNAYLWTNSFLWTDAYLWTNSFLWTDAYLWTNGFLWTDAYLWTDSFMWTDAVTDYAPLYDVSSQSTALDDDLNSN